MPDHRIATDPRCIEVVMSGRVLDADVLRVRGEIKRTSEYDPAVMGAVIDMRQVTELAVSPGFMQQVAIDDRSIPFSRRAFVVASATIFGMLRIYQTLQDPSPVGIFYDIEEARAWAVGGAASATAATQGA